MRSMKKDVKSITDELNAETMKREDSFADIVVPPCDLFELTELPDISEEEESEALLKDHGCFLALLQRKEVTRMDHKYMIKMAELRGLFGDDQSAANKKALSRQRKREEKLREAEQEMKKMNKSKKHSKIHVDRIAAPTHCSFLRGILGTKARAPLDGVCDNVLGMCERHKQHHECQPTRASRWWRQAVRHISTVKMALSWTDNNCVRIAPDRVAKAGRGIRPLVLYRRIRKPKRSPYNVSKTTLEYCCSKEFDDIVESIAAGIAA